MRVQTAAVLLAISMGCVAGCGREAHSEVVPAARPQLTPPPPVAPVAAETSLGLRDEGIWSDLDDKIQLPAPTGKPEDITASISMHQDVLVVSVSGWPVKAYPLLGDTTNPPAPWILGEHRLHLRPGDRAELAGLLTADRIRPAPPLPAVSQRDKPGDHDVDGIPDNLDVLLGAKKTVLNADAYTGGYVRIPYPNGDVPRTIGVCTDVIIRALRNAGIDLQYELQQDLRRARKSYPMVKGSGDPNIDHRRVKTLLPLFLRKWSRRSPALDNAKDPLRTGDILFMDTFPSRSGPDHIGIVSDTLGPSGLPLIINNWTDGTVTAEMDLLTFVPVTHRFRIDSSFLRNPM